MFEPVDQTRILAGGQALVPDYAAQAVREQLLGIQQMQAQTGRDEEARLLARDTRANSRQEQFREAFDAWRANPTVQGMAALVGQFPEFEEQSRRTHAALDERQRTANLGTISQTFSAIRTGNIPLAIEQIEGRRAADQASGGDTRDEDALLEMLRSDDPEDHRRARVTLGIELSHHLGPERFTAALDRMLEDADGPEAEQYARSLGLTAGTDAYRDAMRDFVLRGEGPTAQAHDFALEGAQHENRVELEGVQHGNRVAIERVQHGHRVAEGDRAEQRYRARPAAPQHPSPPMVIGRILDKQARGEALTPGEQRVLEDYKRRERGRQAGRAGAPPSPLPVGTIVRHPQTGERRQRQADGQWTVIR